MIKKSQLAYEEISDGAKFREQYRFVFSAAVVAAVFVIPTGNPFEILLKATVGLSAVFASLYLITSAARVKYSEPGRLYEVFYVSERFRMWTFDWSVHVFAVAFLYFIGLIVTGLIDMIPGINLGPIWSWTVLIIAMLAVGLVTLLITHRIISKKSKKILPEI